MNSALLSFLLSILSLGLISRSVSTYYVSGAANPSEVNVENYGAVGDGQAVADCSTLPSSAVVTCSSSHFVRADVGKMIVIWGAGPMVGKHFVAPLTSKIASYTSANQITLADAASTVTNPSTHTAWGTNNYAAINKALANSSCSTANPLNRSGCVLYFPAGRWLTPTVEIPCGAIGTFGPYRCTSQVSNITIRGASAQSTIIENFKYDRHTTLVTGVAECPYTYTCGVIIFGAKSTNDGALNDAAHWVNGVSIHDLTVQEVQNSNGTFFTEPQNINLGHTSNVEVYNTVLTDSSYMCIAGGNAPLLIHDNYLRRCGWGGPAYSATNSAINTVVAGVKIYHNKIYYSEQCIENGTANVLIENNYCDKRDDPGISTNLPPYPSPGGSTVVTCLNIGSATYGIWDTTIRNNVCKDWTLGGGGSSGSAYNGSGMMTNVTVQGNLFINSGAFALGDGLENGGSIPGGPSTTSIHGTSSFIDNVFRYDPDARGGSQYLGINLNSRKERWIVRDNSIALPGSASCNSCVGLMLNGSFPAWQPSQTLTQSSGNPTTLQPPMPNGYWYAPRGSSGTCTTGSSAPVFPTTVGSTVVDGSCTLKNMGATPIELISNLHISFPPGSRNVNYAVENHGLLSADIIFTNLNVSGIAPTIPGAGYSVNGWNLPGFPVLTWSHSDDATPTTTVKIILEEQTPFSTSLRASLSNNTLQVGSYFHSGDIVNKVTSSAGDSPGWQVTRAGWRAKSWAAKQHYSYNDIVQSSPDDDHIFSQIGAKGCTSGDSQPSWVVRSGATTTDSAGGGSCSWREAGANASIRPLPIRSSSGDGRK